MRTGRYSLSQLLDNDDIDQIIVPEIQRDYVWQKQNVEKLFCSIHTKFRQKVNVSLDIRNAGIKIEQHATDFLTTEYERLLFNTRIGFIYAYYDRSDNRAFYLIDGQQRITTLFLMLLATALEAGQSARDSFRKRFFKNRCPKLDYRVREGAHTFLVDFLDFVLENPDKDFATESPYYYSSEYSKDPTVKAILSNFKLLHSKIKELNEPATKFLDYLENFIEFNYFDTGLSEQGERLYLYMNSRGEALSSQEQIRPTLINRSPAGDKLKAGQLWEQWQDFFWEHRKKGNNADNGFSGFLKLAVIIHQHYHSNTGNSILKKPEKKKGKYQSRREVMEDYIRNYDEYSEAMTQREWIQAYILDNPSFDIAWLKLVFNAIERLSDIYDRHSLKFIREADWRSTESINAINYVPLCGTLMLMIKKPSVSEQNIVRMAWYLLNRSDDSNNSKVADTATLRAMDLAAEMLAAGIDNICRLPKAKLKSNNMYRPDDRFFMCMRLSDSADWENFFRQIISNQSLNFFLQGNHDLLIKLSQYNLRQAENYLQKFRDKIFLMRNSRKLAIEIFQFGDIARRGTGTTNFGPFMKRCKLPAKDDEWSEFFNDESFTHIFKRYFDEGTKDAPMYAMAMKRASGYMENGLFLIEENKLPYPNIVLLKKQQAKHSLARSLPAYLLHKELEGSWLWDEDMRTCSLDFNISANKFETAKNVEGQYCMDFIYHYHGGYWEIILKARPNHAPFTPLQIAAIQGIWGWKSQSGADGRVQFRATISAAAPYDNRGNLPSILGVMNFVDMNKNLLARVL